MVHVCMYVCVYVCVQRESRPSVRPSVRALKASELIAPEGHKYKYNRKIYKIYIPAPLWAPWGPQNLPDGVPQAAPSRQTTESRQTVRLCRRAPSPMYLCIYGVFMYVRMCVCASMYLWCMYVRMCVCVCIYESMVYVCTYV